MIEKQSTNKAEGQRKCGTYREGEGHIQVNTSVMSSKPRS